MLKKIENFVLPEHHNRLYTEEAISSIALAREVAKKINELIDAYNSQSVIHLEKFQEQDGKISKGVLYMKDNLLNSLNEIMEFYRDNGFIDDRILYHCDRMKDELEALSSRVSNLLNVATKPNVGNKDLNLEIIDARVGADGIIHECVGDGIRKQIESVRNLVADVYNMLEFDYMVNTKLVSGYLDDEYILHEAKADQAEVTTDFIPFENDNDVYLLKTICDYPEDGKAWVGVTYYNASKVPLYRTSEEDITEKLIIKQNLSAKYFRVSFRTYKNGNLLVMHKNLKNICDTIPIYQHKYNYEYVDMDFELGYFNAAGGVLDATPTGAEMYSNLIPVNAGEKYVLIANAKNEVGLVGNHAGYLWGAVAYYDANGNFLQRPHTFTATEEREDKKYSIVGEFSVPAGVAFIRVCSRTYWNGSINLALKRNIIPVNDSNALNFENIPSHIKGIAHRGYSAGAPENTLASYRMAKRHGFYYVEGDVRFTSDNVPVMLHDASVDRTSDGSGDIAGLTYAQVRDMDFGSWFSPAYAGTMIPTFDEFIALCKKLGLHPYIELKDGTEAQIRKLYDIVCSYNMERKVTWIGGSPYTTYINAIDPKARIGIVLSSVKSTNIVEYTRMKNDDNEIFFNSNSYTPEEIALCKENNIPLEVWTINNEQEILNLPAYIDGVTSDSLHAGIVCANNY